jgi:hypothetical protein
MLPGPPVAFLKSSSPALFRGKVRLDPAQAEEEDSACNPYLSPLSSGAFTYSEATDTVCSPS